MNDYLGMYDVSNSKLRGALFKLLSAMVFTNKNLYLNAGSIKNESNN